MKSIYLYLPAFLLLMAITACKKTVDYPPLEKNRITEYKVINLADTVIYGVVDNVENTITVYIPYYYGMAVIQPQIKVDESATLSTAVTPVAISSTNQTYTVKSAGGNNRIYKLSIVQQNTPSLVLNWENPEPTVIPEGVLPDITGNFLSTSTATLKVELVSRSTKLSIVPDLTSASIVTNQSATPGNYNLSLPLPLDIDSGYYDVNITYLGHSVKMQDPLHVIYTLPEIATSYSARTVAQGGTTTFLAQTGYIFIDLKSVSVEVNGVVYTLPVKSSDRKQAVITIPDNFPVGEFETATFSFRFGNWDPVTTTANLIVTPK